MISSLLQLLLPPAVWRLVQRSDDPARDTPLRR